MGLLLAMLLTLLVPALAPKGADAAARSLALSSHQYGQWCNVGVGERVCETNYGDVPYTLLTVKGYNFTKMSVVNVNVIDLTNGFVVSGAVRPTNSSGAWVWFSPDIVPCASGGIPVSITAYDVAAMRSVSTVAMACRT
jgi:hypothetical protein